MPEVATNIIKRGENYLQFNLKRGSVGTDGSELKNFGLLFSAKAHPVVEEWARSLGDGLTREVAAHGRSWTAVGGSPLRVYNMSQNIEEGTYHINYAGRPLVYENAINLSWLRLQGISEGDGIKFAVAGVMDKDAIHDLRDRMINAARSFCLSYLCPIDLTVAVSSQDLHG